MNRFIPDPLEQAGEILEMLETNGLDVADSIEPEDIVGNIDPEKPVSVNFRTVADAFKGTL